MSTRAPWTTADAMPRERPILFSAPMVRALMAGSKTQTRRAVKEPGWATPHTLEIFNGIPMAIDPFKGDRDVLCPYGIPGDTMWVRESGWERPERTPKMMRDGADTWAPYYYDADGITDAEADEFKAWGFKRRPSIFMPRAASRITLTVMDVRVERLHDISEADAIAEGITRRQEQDVTMFFAGVEAAGTSAVWCYRQLWESINGHGSWDANSLVWVVSFVLAPPNPHGPKG